MLGGRIVTFISSDLVVTHPSRNSNSALVIREVQGSGRRKNGNPSSEAQHSFEVANGTLLKSIAPTWMWSVYCPDQPATLEYVPATR